MFGHLEQMRWYRLIEMRWQNQPIWANKTAKQDAVHAVHEVRTTKSHRWLLSPEMLAALGFKRPPNLASKLPQEWTRRRATPAKLPPSQPHR